MALAHLSSALRIFRAVVTLAIMTIMAALWLAIPADSRFRRSFVVAMWRVLLQGLGIQVRCHGKMAPAAGTLYVANHVSWADIAVLASLLDAGFVAKGEVARWPVIGALARSYGCLFVDRDRRSTALDQSREVRHRLAEAVGGLILFPEGTTSDGSALLPFRSSLFPIGAEGTPAVAQPIALIYRTSDGTPLCAQGRRRVAWLDDDTLLPHVMALVASGGVGVDVHFGAPVALANRKLLAARCQEDIAARLAASGLPDSTDPAPLSSN